VWGHLRKTIVMDSLIVALMYVMSGPILLPNEKGGANSARLGVQNAVFDAAVAPLPDCRAVSAIKC
jgi:hypothetical protein